MARAVDLPAHVGPREFCLQGGQVVVRGARSGWSRKATYPTGFHAIAGAATEGDCRSPRGRRADGDAARVEYVGAILAKIARRHPRHSLLHDLPQRRRPFLRVGAGSEVTKFAVDLEIARFHAGVV